MYYIIYSGIEGDYEEFKCGVVVCHTKEEASEVIASRLEGYNNVSPATIGTNDFSCFTIIEGCELPVTIKKVIEIGGD